MKNTIFVVLLSLVCSGLIAQKENRRLDVYNRIDVSGGINIELLEGSPKAEIEVKEGDIEKLRTEVKNGKLIIKFGSKSWFNWGNQEAHIKLYGATELNSIEASAGSYVHSSHHIQAEDFDLSVSSGARVEIGLKANTASVSASSGAGAELSGQADHLNASASSGARIEAHSMECLKAKVSASSGAGIKLWVTDDLTASVGSGGSVRYKGEPSNTNIKSGKYSGGSVSKL